MYINLENNSRLVECTITIFQSVYLKALRLQQNFQNHSAISKLTLLHSEQPKLYGVLAIQNSMEFWPF